MKDTKIITFGVLNLLQGAMTGVIPLLALSREPIVNWVIGAAAILMLLSGPALVFAGRVGRIIAAAACLFHGLLGTVIAALTAGSASYLYGIYGRHGHSLGAIAAVLAVMVLVVFWLIPAHELAFLRKSGKPR